MRIWIVYEKQVVVLKTKQKNWYTKILTDWVCEWITNRGLTSDKTRRKAILAWVNLLSRAHYYKANQSFRVFELAFFHGYLKGLLSYFAEGSTEPSLAREYCLLRDRVLSIFGRYDRHYDVTDRSNCCCWWNILDRSVTPLNRPFAATGIE